jgi:hypothetical protein
MSDRALIQNDNIECPLCLGQGQLTRAEVLERLGMKDFARIAQLSAEEAFRLLLKEHKDEENTLWLRFITFEIIGLPPTIRSQPDSLTAHS